MAWECFIGRLFFTAMVYSYVTPNQASQISMGMMDGINNICDGSIATVHIDLMRFNSIQFSVAPSQRRTYSRLEWLQ